jgi:HK97 family phage prohead protease
MTHAPTRDIGTCSRSYDFELRSTGRGGRRLVGTVAMFNKRTRIPDRGGDFEEELHPGFARRSLREHGLPVMQFDHGKDPRTGTVPIGRYDSFEETRTGYDVEGELFDNALVEPIRQAIEGRAIKGMSFRFHVSKNGDKWERRHGGMDLRRVLDADVPEAGPVVFPAYRDTAVAVRSILATFDDEELAEAIRELRAMAGLATDLTGEPSTRSGGRGDPDAQPREGDAPNPAQLARIRAMQTLRNPIAFP